MSYVDYKKLELKNFRSYKELEFEFRPGIHLVLGDNQSSSSSSSNGGGKSSPFLSLAWTQFGYSSFGSDPSRDYKGNCMTAVDFVKDGKEYRIERYHKDKAEKNGVKLFLDGEEISNRKKRDTEADIDKILNIPAELFVSCVVVTQGLPVNFTDMTPTLRKSIAESMLGFDIWDSFRPAFSTRLREQQLERNTCESQYSESKDDLIRLNSRLETMRENQERSQQDFTAKAKVIKEKMKELRDSLEAKSEHIQKEEESVGLSYDSLNESIQTNLVNYQKLSSSLKVLKSRASSLFEILDTKVCTECKQNYPTHMIEGAESELAQIKDKKGSLIEKMQEVETQSNKLKEAESRMRDIQQDIRTYRTQLQSYTSQLQQISQESKLKIEDSDIKELEQELSGLKGKVESLSQSLRENEKEVSHLAYLDKMLLPSSPFRTLVLEKYIGHINEIIESIRPLIFDDVEISLGISDRGNGIDLVVKKDDKVYDYRALSGGEKRRLDIIVILSFQRFLMESSGFTTNLLVFDEIFDGLDQQGINSVLSCIETLFPDTSCIYVITHNNNIKSAFHSVIRVVKENGLSQIMD